MKKKGADDVVLQRNKANKWEITAPKPYAADQDLAAPIKKAAGGKTIQEIYAAQSKLAGQPVAVRGKVVKYNAMILGKTGCTSATAPAAPKTTTAT